jgi:DNA-binding NarL/FixJ family response regulator
MWAPFDRPLALVLAAAPDDRFPSERDLTELFGLSRAEIRLASALLQGKKLRDIATDTGLRITTLRTQLSSILKKVGVERQPDLIRPIRHPGCRSFVRWLQPVNRNAPQQRPICEIDHK